MKDDRITTPDWLKDAVFYQIFPDRFARSASSREKGNFQPWGAKPTAHSFQGGDFPGMTEKLDYLSDLGINAIYLNPIFRSASNHRYHTHDYFKTDPLLGDNKAFKTFLDAAHNRGIRVILDGVFNHASRGFFQFNHILECGPNSPYIDWFHINDFPLNAYDSGKKPNYSAWYGLRELPKFNTDNPQVRRFLLDVASYWIDFGIDGWRLDVPEEIDDDNFWEEFREAVKGKNRDAYIVGEIWKDEISETGERWLKGDQFDAIMNYGFTSICIRFFIGDALDVSLVAGQGHVPKKVSMNALEFEKQIEVLLKRYHREIVYNQYNLLDSHDTARYLTLCGGDKEILKLTTIFQMTYPGAPSIYYGGEIGLEGGRDPDCRRAMPWDSNVWDMDLLNHYKKFIHIRKTYRSLGRGDYKSLYCDAEKGVYAFVRFLDKESIVVILNNSTKPYKVDIPLKNSLNDGATLRCLLNNGEYIVNNGAVTGPEIDARRGVVLLAES